MMKYILFLILPLTAGCQANGSHQQYDLRNPVVIELPKEVDQISGIVYQQKENAVFAIDDDHGNLYRITLEKKPDIQHWEFGKDRDYEEIVLHDNTFYVLVSNGGIVSFPFSFPVKETKKAEPGIKGKNEFEILFKDPDSNRLLMMCKECANDDKNEVSVYAFNPGSNAFEQKPVATLDVKAIEKKLGEKTGRFKPSAANVHPITGEVYIVSAINKLLVITDKDFSVKEVYELDEKRFKQPEGLCFTPSGDMLISNEAAGKGKATILIFKNSRK